jgi:hypothetical protein
VTSTPTGQIPLVFDGNKDAMELLEVEPTVSVEETAWRN